MKGQICLSGMYRFYLTEGVWDRAISVAQDNGYVGKYPHLSEVGGKSSIAFQQEEAKELALALDRWIAKAVDLKLVADDPGYQQILDLVALSRFCHLEAFLTSMLGYDDSDLPKAVATIMEYQRRECYPHEDAENADGQVLTTSPSSK